MASYTEKLTLGISKILESSPGISEVKFDEKSPAERHAIVSWEQKNSCSLPEDLKNFYLMTDGFQMTWSVKMEDSVVQVGSMIINSISNLICLGESSLYSLLNTPTLADLDDEPEGDDLPEQPQFSSKNMIFELDPCSGNGKVCLVYKTSDPGQSVSDPEIWFLDRALYWHFITYNFTSYYRLLLCHLGLPQWQYLFTGYGLSPQAKQWFNMYRPVTLGPGLTSEETESFINKLDPNKIFKNKNKTPTTKKKFPLPPSGAQKGNVAASRNPSGSVNPVRK